MTQELGKCKKHPRYRYTKKPKKTGMYPKGCPACWELWRQACQVTESKKGIVTNPEGKNQHSGDMKEYAKRITKDGHVLVDRLDAISMGVTPGSTVKDELAATKMLVDITKDIDEDRPQDIRVLVLNLKDTTFKEYQDGS